VDDPEEKAETQRAYKYCAALSGSCGCAKDERTPCASITSLIEEGRTVGQERLRMKKGISL
jgi:hypothetical protein